MERINLNDDNVGNGVVNNMDYILIWWNIIMCNLFYVLKNVVIDSLYMEFFVEFKIVKKNVIRWC